MPPPEMKAIAFKRPSLLELNALAEDFSKAMIPTDLLTTLKDKSKKDYVAICLLPAFGFLYIATESKIHQYDPNILEFKAHPFRIQKKNSMVEICQDLEDSRMLENGKNVLFRFGTYSDESMGQAKAVAKEMEALLGYEITVAE